MNHDELKNAMDSRFDRLEAKLDKYAAETIKATSDLIWVKGGVKFLLTMFLAISTTVLGWLLTK